MWYITSVTMNNKTTYFILRAEDIGIYENVEYGPMSYSEAKEKLKRLQGD